MDECLARPAVPVREISAREMGNGHPFRAIPGLMPEKPGHQVAAQPRAIGFGLSAATRGGPQFPTAACPDWGAAVSRFAPACRGGFRSSLLKFGEKPGCMADRVAFPCHESIQASTI